MLQLTLEVLMDKTLLVQRKVKGALEEERLVCDQHHAVSKAYESLVEVVQTVILVTNLLKVTLNFLLIRHFVQLNIFNLSMKLRLHHRLFLVCQSCLFSELVQIDLFAYTQCRHGVILLEVKGSTFKSDVAGIPVCFLEFDEAVDEEDGELGG